MEVTRHIGPRYQVSIPDTIDGREVTGVGAEILGCDETYLYIPDTVRYIDTSRFQDYKELSSVGVSENSEYYSSKSGMLTDKAITKIIRAAVKRTKAEIPNTVTEISANAFLGCNIMTYVYIPESVETIGSYAFFDCTSLKRVIVPGSVTDIGEYAFGYKNGTEGIVTDDELEIMCYKNSAAEEYAQKNGISYTLIDDHTGKTSVENAELEYSNRSIYESSDYIAPPTKPCQKYLT